MQNCAAALRVARASNCPATAWLQVAVDSIAETHCGSCAQSAAASSSSSSSPPAYFLNVGANKGYHIAEFLSALSQRHALTNQYWHETLLSVATHKLRRPIKAAALPCGGCAECNTTRTPVARTGCCRVAIHAFDALPANVDLLRGVFSALSVPATVHQGIVSNASGTSYSTFRYGHSGDELAVFSADRGGYFKYAQQAVSVDDFLDSQSIRDVHWLSVDTEGWDALVLEGAARALMQRRIWVVQFEYNRVGYWRKWSSARRDLKSTLASLHEFGYTCFWDGNKGVLAQANGEAWCDAFEIRAWSNLVCSHDPRLVERFRALAPASKS